MGADGQIIVRVIGERVVECSAHGHLTSAHMRDAAMRLDEILAGASDATFCALFDGTGIESFSPGLPAQWLSWSARRQRFARTAVVGRVGPMFGLASMFRYLLPKRRLAAFTHRSAALAWLESANDVRDG